MLYTYVNPHNVLAYLLKLVGRPVFSMEEEIDRNWSYYRIHDDQGGLWTRMKVLQSRDQEGITHSEILFADFRPRKLDHIRLPKWDITLSIRRNDVGALVAREDYRYHFFGMLPWSSPPTDAYPTEIFLRNDTIYDIVAVDDLNKHQPNKR